MSKRSQSALYSPIAVPGRSLSRMRLSPRATAPSARSPSVGTSEISSFELDSTRQARGSERRRTESPASLRLPASLSLENCDSAPLRLPQNNRWRDIPISSRHEQSSVGQSRFAPPARPQNIISWVADQASPETQVVNTPESDHDADVSDSDSWASDDSILGSNQEASSIGRRTAYLNAVDSDSGSSDSSDDESIMSQLSGFERAQAFRNEHRSQARAVLANVDRAEANAEILGPRPRGVRRPVRRFVEQRPFREVSFPLDTSDDSSSPRRGVSPALSAEENIFRMT